MNNRKKTKKRTSKARKKGNIGKKALKVVAGVGLGAVTSYYLGRALLTKGLTAAQEVFISKVRKEFANTIWNDSLDNYKYVRRLGEGSFGFVKQFEDSRTKEQVAIKEINLRSKALLHVKREIECLQRLKKIGCEEYFVCYKTHFADKNNLYIVTNYIAGKTLADYENFILGRPDKLNAASIKTVMLKIAKGVQILHRHKIAHLDLKPLNILVKENDDITIIDFGGACPDGHCLSNEIWTHSAPETKTFFANKTPYLLSLSQLFKQDIYALGGIFVVLWYVLGARGKDEEYERIDQTILNKMTNNNPNNRWNIDQVVKFLQDDIYSTTPDVFTRIYNFFTGTRQ